MIINGDCLEVMDKLIEQGVTVDCTITDIPYGEVSKNGAERAKYQGQLRKIDKGQADILEFDLEAFLEKVSILTNGGIYIFCGIEQISIIYKYFDNHKDFMVRQCAWRKTNPSPVNGQYMWLSSFENCIFAKKRKTKFNQSCKSSVWDFPVGRKKYGHPTEKPEPLFHYLMESSSDKNDTIFDPCMGSGTLGAVAKKANRNFIGIELDETYFEIAKNRIESIQPNLF